MDYIRVIGVSINNACIKGHYWVFFFPNKFVLPFQWHPKPLQLNPNRVLEVQNAAIALNFE